MANSLLDFVLSLVRDPDAAAHYAANPTQAIADANLTDVTSADVNHLIPVVAESMSSAVPSGGVPTGADTMLDATHNVWASGAATAAFDAFDDHLPLQGSDVVADHVPLVANVIQLPADSTPTIVDHDFDAASVPTIAAPMDHAMAFDMPAVDEGHLPDAPAVEDSHHLDPNVGEDHGQISHDPGFDVFT